MELFHENIELKSVPYEQIEFAAEELTDMASRLRFMRDCLPEVAQTARKQIEACAKQCDERANKLRYDSCEHVWIGHKNPNTPDGPGDYFEFCDKCGAEKQDD